MKKPVPNKYPPYPDSNWDYSVRETANMALVTPNKHICIYCHYQAVELEKLVHAVDCPAKDKKPVEIYKDYFKH